jgi:hypothetical protein
MSCDGAGGVAGDAGFDNAWVPGASCVSPMDQSISLNHLIIRTVTPQAFLLTSRSSGSTVESSMEVESSRAVVPVLQHRRAMKLHFP